MAEQFDAYHVWLGIPPTEQPPTHYRLLGLAAFESDGDVISNAADRQMAHLRTLNTSKRAILAQKLLNEMSAARACLLDAEKKLAYDSELKRKNRAAHPTPKAAPRAETPGAEKGAAKPEPDRPAAAPVAKAAAAHGTSLDAGPAEKSPAPLDPPRRFPAWMMPAVIGGAGLVLVAMVAVGVAVLGGGNGTRPSDVAEGSRRGPVPPPATSPTVPGAGSATGRAADRTIPSTPASPGGASPQASPFVPQPQPGAAASAVEGKVDLLKVIDPARDAVEGTWSIEAGALVSPGTRWARLQIPVDLPEEYVLTAEIHRMSGWRNFGLGVIVGGRQTRVVLDSFLPNVGIASGLTVKDSANGGMGETMHPGRAMVDARPTVVVCTVRKSSVRVSCEGVTVVNWSGDVGRLANRAETAVPDPAKPFLATGEGVFRITRLELAPLKGGGIPPPAATLTESKGYRPGLVGEYVVGRIDSGNRVGFNVDPRVRLDYATSAGSPVPTEAFSVRWSGFLGVPETGRYTLTIRADDEATLWIDDQPIVTDRWGGHLQQRATVSLEAGLHGVRVVYWQGIGLKNVSLAWSREGDPDEHEIAAEYFFHDPAQAGSAPPASVAGRPQPPPAGTSPPAAVQSPPPAVQSPPPSLSARLPVPDTAKRDEAQKLASELYAKEIAGARRPADKIELAQTILSQANRTTQDATGRYVLLAMGRDLAVDGGDAELSLKVVDQIAAEYEVDAFQERVAAIRKLGGATVPAATHKANVDALLKVLDELVAGDAYNHAAEVAQAMVDSARRAGDPPLLRFVVERQKETASQKSQYAPVAEAVETLKTSPDDAAANLALGRWLWFVKDDFAGALPRLAKGSDASLKAAAAKELGATASADGQYETAEAWHDAAQTRGEPEKTIILVRAHHGYKTSAGGLIGLRKTKAEKQAGDLQAMVDKFEQERVEKAIAARRATGQLAPGLVGEYFSGMNFEQKLGTRVDAGVGLEFALASGSGVPADGFSIRWSGLLIPPKPGRYRIVGQCDDGIRVLVDGKQAVNAWRFVTGQQPLQVQAYVTLGREPVPFQVEYFQFVGSKGLALSWEQEGGFPLQPISPRHFYHAKQ
jgi:hypothetical protein